MTRRSRTVDDGRMADPANVTWSLLSWCCRRRVAHHMKSVFAGFNFRRLNAIHCAMSSMQSVRRSSTSRASCCLADTYRCVSSNTEPWGTPHSIPRLERSNVKNIQDRSQQQVGKAETRSTSFASSYGLLLRKLLIFIHFVDSSILYVRLSRSAVRTTSWYRFDDLVGRSGASANCRALCVVAVRGV